MSKAEASRNPSWAIIRNFLFRNHCTPPSDRFVSGVAVPGALGSLGSPSWKHLSGQTTGRAWDRIPSVAQCGAIKRYESLRSAYGGHGIELGASRIGMGPAARPQNCTDAETAGDGEMHNESRSAVTSHAFTANPKPCRPEGRVRGQKSCR
jgi:hypothetical protein